MSGSWHRQMSMRSMSAAIALAVGAAACSAGDSPQLRLDPSAGEPTSTIDGQVLDDAGTDPTPPTPPPSPVPSETNPVAAAGPTNGEASVIRVDQFGYRPSDAKVSVIADPQVGFDADTEFLAGERYEVRDWASDAVVFAGGPEAWADGAVHSQSGDRGWWFDFTEVDMPGSYYIVDVDNDVATGRFEVGDDVYDDVLDSALRMFWFNRGNTDHPADLGGPSADAAAYVGEGQDTEARSVDARSDPSTARDLSGGWFDAGDTNKYVTFSLEPVHSLLTLYEGQPDLFDDDVGIPESFNGIPDILDEVHWEIDWLERMQESDGGVLTKVGLVDGASGRSPSEARAPRFYEQVCSSSTIAAAGMFAHAALAFATAPELIDDAAQLRVRAEQAWDWYQSHDKRDDCDAQIVRAGDADLSIDEQYAAEVVAAVYLYALTGQSHYNAVVRDGYATTIPFSDIAFGRYGPDQSDALIY